MRLTSIGRRSALAGAGSLLVAPAIVRAQGKTNGVALVIGNSKYAREAQLPNVRRDAPDIAKRFESFGLKTELVQDAGRDAMNRALEKFGAAAKGADFAAFYFAGHGASWGRD
ncbi:MAG: caspase family protein, partial [Enhydrobacter sp.]